MIAALRTLLSRPIVHDRRRLAFGVAATVLAAVALVPLLAGHDGHKEHHQPEARRTQKPRLTPTTPAGTTATQTQPQPTLYEAGATSFVRRFLPSYLAYTYGLTDAQPLREFVHPSLWLDLAAHPPHVPSRTRELHPRVTYIGITATRSSAVALEALIDDGKRHYAIPLVVRAVGERWQIVWIGT
jgi:hypothetical protein